MKIELIDDPELVKMMGYPDNGTRSEGLHLSDIIKALMRRLQPKRFSSAPFVMTPRMEMGILFESALEWALVRKYATVRPGEIVSPEGVAMSPDGINPLLIAGEEYKCTSMSSRGGIVDENGQPLDKYIHWFMQMKGYAKWLEVNLFILRVFFVNGNYNRSGLLKDGSVDLDAGPTLRNYHITFSDEEIDDNWSMLMNVAREEGLL